MDGWYSPFRRHMRHHHRGKSEPQNFVPPIELQNYALRRELGYRNSRCLMPQSLKTIGQDYCSYQLPGLLKEREYNLGEINKIFASSWLTHQQVVVGTKCNKLIILDTQSGNLTQIPSLRSSDNSTPAECPCGIHAISINPSRTLLATGATHTNDLAIYKLPTFDPVCTGESGHDDWIFDIKWIDDQFVISGSRDGKLSLWQIKESDLERQTERQAESEEESMATDIPEEATTVDDSDESDESEVPDVPEVPEVLVKSPKTCKKLSSNEKIRALAVNTTTNEELAALTLNAYVYIYDLKTLKQRMHCRLHHSRENVCMNMWPEHNIYAIGSQSNVTFIDTRSKKPKYKNIDSMQKGCGIRSLNFHRNMLTIGTGAGQVFFYDMRNEQYLNYSCEHPCSLVVGKGWLRHDESFRDFFMDQDYPNAIYTHSFDSTGTKVFAAGGPLPAGLHGNYAATWQ